ncbi:MraY family glycosyltransferase [Nocardioides sp. C4-1]|uniref:glycosyltransferase family 4 protein n=1 Tax=Nocardioides sp. C4-1 TaxID=3151851 RepID=UPI003267B9DC
MREYLVVFLVAGAITYLLTVVAREIAVRTRAYAAVRDRDVHETPTPYLGGIAMLGGLVAAYVVAQQLPFLSTSLSASFTFEDVRGVIAAGALICGVGVLDDIFDLDALTKFGGQVLAVGLLVLSGIQFRFFYTPGGGQFALDESQGAILTALIVITTVNAVNFVDGLDGLAAGVVGISAAAFFVYCYMLSDLNGVTLATTGALLSAALAGVCTGFLIHNFHPARIFMGDSGSMLIGLMLSATAITVTTQFSDEDIAMGAEGARASLLPMLLPVALPILILIVPLIDLILAIIRRTRAGQSPFAPDKLHLHHRLLEIGHSHRRAVLILWMWAGSIAASTVLVSLVSDAWSLLVVGGLAVVALLLTFLLPRLHGPGISPPLDAPAPEPSLDVGATETL